MKQRTALAKHDAVKAAAQSLLKSGLASYAEIAALSGYSRQTIRWFAGELGAESAREEHLAKLWRDALRRSNE